MKLLADIRKLALSSLGMLAVSAFVPSLQSGFPLRQEHEVC